MAFTMHVHQRDPKDSSRIIKVKPYARFNKQGETPVFIQDGRFYTEGGKHINQPKEDRRWAFDAAEELSDKVKKEVGYVSEPKKRGAPTLAERKAKKEAEDNGND